MGLLRKQEDDNSVAVAAAVAAAVMEAKRAHEEWEGGEAKS